MKLTTILLAGAALAGATGAQAQSLTGHRVGIQYYFPSQGELLEDDGANTVGTSGPTAVLGSEFDIRFTNSTATIGNFAENNSFVPASFSGVRLYDIDGQIGDFSATIGANNFAGFNMSRLSGDANNLYLNFQGLSFNTATSLTINFAQPGGAVPEPATWGMMVLGFGLVGAGLRRRATARTGVRFA